MSVELINEEGEKFRVNNLSWARMMTLARVAGWQPAGTCEPPGWSEEDPEDRWDPMDYTGHYGQCVNDADAIAIGEALERALQHVPESVPMAPNVFTTPEEVLGYIILGQEAVWEMRESFAADEPTLGKFGWMNLRRKSILNLARFCRAGGFKIT